MVLIPLVLLAVFRAPDWLFTLLVGVVAVLATVEYLQIAAKYGYRVYRGVTVGAVALLYMGGAVASWSWESRVNLLMLFMGAAFMFSPFLILAIAMKRENLRESLPGAAISYFGIGYVGLSLLSLALLRMLPAGWFFVLFTFFAVWVGDTAAYYVGRSMGKTKFATRISPKKTWEGAIASVVGAMIVGVLWTWYGPQLANVHWLVVSEPIRGGYQRPSMLVVALVALVINVAAQLGDLFESLIKRGADVKDSGTMLPGHGGILDRIDALLFAAPVALVMFLLFAR